MGTHGRLPARARRVPRREQRSRPRSGRGAEFVPRSARRRTAQRRLIAGSQNRKYSPVTGREALSTIPLKTSTARVAGAFARTTSSEIPASKTAETPQRISFLRARAEMTPRGLGPVVVAEKEGEDATLLERSSPGSGTRWIASDTPDFRSETSFVPATEGRARSQTPRNRRRRRAWLRTRGRDGDILPHRQHHDGDNHRRGGGLVGCRKSRAEGARQSGATVPGHPPRRATAAGSRSPSSTRPDRRRPSRTGTAG